MTSVIIAEKGPHHPWAYDFHFVSIPLTGIISLDTVEKGCYLNTCFAGCHFPASSSLAVRAHRGPVDLPSLVFYSEHSEYLLCQMLSVAPFCQQTENSLLCWVFHFFCKWLAHILSATVSHSFIHFSIYSINVDSLPLLCCRTCPRFWDVNKNSNNVLCSQRSNNSEEDKHISQNHKKHCLWQWDRCLFRAEQGHKEGRAQFHSGIGLENNQKVS